jgi:cardiolipin synthase
MVSIMTAPPPPAPSTSSAAPFRPIARRAFSRVAGAQLSSGNAVELLIDAHENYAAWLAAIRGARTSILFENYIFGDDEVSRAMRDALVERARAGVGVWVIRDWLGCLRESRDSFWDPLRAAGGEVRTYNPFRIMRPFAWLSRDHRKLVVVDSNVGFVSGLCVSARWLGDPARGVAPWRDTGVAVRGPAVREIAAAFAENWSSLGLHLPADLPVLNDELPAAGDVNLRVIATSPSSAGLYRLEQLLASIAQHTLWLSDAYFVGTAPYVQSLIAAARDGVDVRLLVPAASDLPLVGAISRAGYRSLLEAGIRVYEWRGMLHAKTAVIDRRWARVGSSNLNPASWMANAEIDIGIENEAFAQRMHAQYEADLRGATEIVLGPRHAIRGGSAAPASRRRASSGRTAASALRLANTVGAAVSDHRVLGATENRILLAGAMALSGVAAVGFYQPRVVAWPLATVATWCAVSLASRYAALARRRSSALARDQAAEPSR